MALYEFSCPDDGDFTITRSMNEAADPAWCPTCKRRAQRVFTVPRFNENDQFRSWWKSGRGAHAFDERAPHGYIPRDKEEAQALGRATGRIYIGDDTTSLRANAQAAIRGENLHKYKKPEKRKRARMEKKI